MSQTRKVVYHCTYGGFNLTRAATERLAELGQSAAIEELESRRRPEDVDGVDDPGWVRFPKWLYPDENELPRHDPLLVQVVEELGEAAGENLRIVEVTGPYRIDAYDGNETVETPSSYGWK